MTVTHHNAFIEKTFDNETLKMNHLLVSEMAFKVAKELELRDLFTDVNELISNVAASRLKRTPDFQSFGKTWGSLVAEFISRKWNCLNAILSYMKLVSLNSGMKSDYDRMTKRSCRTTKME